MRTSLQACMCVLEVAHQKRTMPSPPPLASWRPEGEKLTCRMASVCPGMESLQRVTGRTWKLSSCW
jgi:hypothetical protein